MLAMALLLPGGHLGGLGGTAREVGGSREGVLTPPTVPDGFRWGVETGELAHLLPPCLFLAFARPAESRVASTKSSSNEQEEPEEEEQGEESKERV